MGSSLWLSYTANMRVCVCECVLSVKACCQVTAMCWSCYKQQHVLHHWEVNQREMEWKPLTRFSSETRKLLGWVSTSIIEEKFEWNHLKH